MYDPTRGFAIDTTEEMEKQEGGMTFKYMICIYPFNLILTNTYMH